MTRATNGIRYISTEALFQRITRPQTTPSMKSERSNALLARFGLRPKSIGDFLLLDVRSCIEAEHKGMIIGAQLLPSFHIYYALTQPKERLQEMFGLTMPEKRDEIICYADAGTRVQVAHATLRYLGYHNVQLYKEGFEAFEKAYPHLIGRLPVENQERPRDSQNSELPSPK